MYSHRPVFLGFFINFLLVFSYADRPEKCSKKSSLVGYQSEFTMAQHQLRGLFTVIDDCSFRVSHFDLLSGSDVHWWGAIQPDFSNFTRGFVISDQILNQTYKNASFTVHMLENITWDRISVLSVWDLPTASDFGHILLPNGSNSGISVSPDAAPSPSNSAVPSGEQSRSRGFTVPTMFHNCKVLSESYRLRWTLNMEEESIDIGLEAAIEVQNYMAFGWAKPHASSELMLGADVAMTGFTEDRLPFADDFYITRYTECLVKKDGSASGVCPDVVYQGSNPLGQVNNTKLVYGHRKDGVSFVRYRRYLKSIDKKYDLNVHPSEDMTVIWALGPIRPPDTLRPYYLPQNHGGLEKLNYGHLVLNVSKHMDDCFGPLVAENKEDQDVIIADANVPLVVTSAPALHYPNPPNPLKVLYINKKESPMLRVERGVPVKFSIQAGHGVALYITSDMLGGNATLRNKNETIYAGGSDAHGVQASPTELVWAPDRNTPDQVYYHSVYQQKMGWRVQVVDGGLSDMYNNSVFLDDQQVTFFWTLAKDSIAIAARGEKKSGYLAIGFGNGMVNSYAYVGWFDSNGTGRVSSYWIDGQDASSVHPTNENLTHVRCKSEKGIITLEFTRPLIPSCIHSDRPECQNLIDSTTPLKVIWAMGAKWTEGDLSERNMHSVTSQRPIRVMLIRGSAEAEQDLRPVLAVHGFMMFLAWGILLPAGTLAARYLKHVKGDKWFQIHVYLQYSGLSIVLLGLLFAVAELQGFFLSSLHVKFGLSAILLACAQPLNAYLRPPKPGNGVETTFKRILWEYVHVVVGRSAIVAGAVALFTGMKHLGDRYDGVSVQGLIWALAMWFIIGSLITLYLEFTEKQRRKERVVSRSNWVFGNSEEDDSTDLLSPQAEKESQQSFGRMEVQLEPLNR